MGGTRPPAGLRFCIVSGEEKTVGRNKSSRNTTLTGRTKLAVIGGRAGRRASYLLDDGLESGHGDDGDPH